MRSYEDAILNYIAEAEVALARARAEISSARLERTILKFAPQPPEPVVMVAPDPELTDEPPSRPA